ncbi:transglycosylase SLT domain-containing protein [Streptomyces sp. DSM 44917]|uniref:Transglycosylase SLT domain-containing protein n=1 Tax=Streptomyces boetiae TaxID=3075541 RepID=A0ABU2LD40_9ACTN|nr:transglycosylase SLT domain-containing protein [Streptomyces sp. DSM 44917]MDT0309499.1 transglycosylase SLT domain-containing protein [Streptomyces sp. DSM 44917]
MPVISTLGPRPTRTRRAALGVAALGAAALAAALAPGSAQAATAGPAAPARVAEPTASPVAFTLDAQGGVAHAIPDGLGGKPFLLTEETDEESDTDTGEAGSEKSETEAEPAEDEESGAEAAEESAEEGDEALAPEKPEEEAAEEEPEYPDNLDGWIREAMAVMDEHGIPGSYEGIHRNIIRESSGDPQAINLWDINAQNGIPSKGLLQVIDPTFAAYHVEGTKYDPYDPVANIVAACNYAADRYGSMDNVWGAY